jgi:hypothetical protein
MSYHIIDPNLNELIELRAQAKRPDGVLRVMPKDFYAQFEQGSLSAFCVEMGCYSLPTIELLDLVNAKIMGASPSRHAIEVGSGNGVIGEALGITCTDNWMQDDPIIKAHYESLRQPTAPYRSHVERYDALKAIERYKPEVVVASWVTHIYNPAEPQREGNAFGVDEDVLLDRIKRYVFIGNLITHSNKPILARKHEIIQGDFLFSRSLQREDNALIIWDTH